MSDTTVKVLDPALEWIMSLDEKQQEKVDFYFGLLEQEGVALDYPYSSALEGTDYAFRELRVKASNSALRIVYAFDPARDAVVILGGDKKGQKEKRFYKKLIKEAESHWEEYLEGFDE